MFSYIFMKILESRPRRYDEGINILTFGHAAKVREHIITKYVKPGTSMLDIGCGTGTMLVRAAGAGADAAGIDISEGMLKIARERIRAEGLSRSVELHHSGAADAGILFPENSFDLVTATIVISELYPEERRFVFREIRKLLKESGTLVIAGETIPGFLPARILYYIMRFPLALITRLLSQTGTTGVKNISAEIRESGFVVREESRSFMGSFTMVSAGKAEVESRQHGLHPGKNPADDISLMRTVWDFAGRWFPCSVEPGLRTIGKPVPASPVFVTSNYHLTVRRIERALKNENCHLLIAPTGGINVWCASCGGEMNTHSVSSVIKTSRISERTDHSIIILPQLSAPGIDPGRLLEVSGWHARFGPVYARELHRFLSRGGKITPEQQRARFPISFRLEMLFSMNILIWVAAAAVLLAASPGAVLPLSALFWFSGIVLYGAFPLFPVKSGLARGMAAALVEIAGIAIYSRFILQTGWSGLWHWAAAALAVNLWLGFDLMGIAGAYPSEAAGLISRIGITSIGRLYKHSPEKVGSIHLESTKCTGCGTCITICPVDVFEKNRVNLKSIASHPDKCFTCGACVRQCPEDALSLS